MNISSKVQEYFNNGRRKVREVVPKQDYTLHLVFDNGEKRVYAVPRNGVFKALENRKLFDAAFIEDGCVCWDIDPLLNSHEVWNNRIDLCTDSLYINSLPL